MDPVRTLGFFSSRRTSPEELRVWSDLPGQNRNEAALEEVRSPSPENSRSPGRALSGVSASARSNCPPPAFSTRPIGSSGTAAKLATPTLTKPANDNHILRMLYLFFRHLPIDQGLHRVQSNGRGLAAHRNRSQL